MCDFLTKIPQLAALLILSAVLPAFSQETADTPRETRGADKEKQVVFFTSAIARAVWPLVKREHTPPSCKPLPDDRGGIR